MKKLALITGHLYVYWSDIVTLLAAGAALCLFLALYPRRGKRMVSALLYSLLAGILSPMLSRLAYWYFRPDSYASLSAVLDWQQPGGSMLAGAFAGCLLAAVLLRFLRMVRSLPDLLDCLSIAGCVGIAVGRLACFFNTDNRGMLLAGSLGLPWVVATVNPVSGAMEYRLATFLLQSISAGVIGLALLAVYLAGNGKPGDTALLFLMFYGASQVLLDSTRYDSLYFRSNGFVSIVQVLGACALGLTAVVFSVRLVRHRGWRGWYAVLWTALAGTLGLAGFMEYFVQRWSKKLAFGYSVMTAALAVVVVLVLVVRGLAVSAEKKEFAFRQQSR